MRVVATNKYQELNIMDGTLQRIPMEGEEFEISEDRFELLNGNNYYKVVFVKPLDTYIQEVETTKKTVKKETATKKTTKTTKKTTKKKSE